MKLTFSDLSATLPKSETLAFLVGEENALPPLLAAADKKSGGSVLRAAGATKFRGKKGQSLTFAAPTGFAAERVVLVGVGNGRDALALQAAGGALVRELNAAGAKTAHVVVELPPAKADKPAAKSPKPAALSPVEAAANLAHGAQLRAYRFDKYRTTQKPEEKPTLSALTVLSPQSKAAAGAHARLAPVAEAVHFARDLISEPANVIYPESLAAQCRALSRLGVEVEVLGEAAMKKLGMNALLGVGQGSERESQLVVMRWNGAGAKSKGAPLAFVGKGVCFDTGGISIKPANGMEEMKWDMGGAGAVIGLMRALAGRKAKVNAVGVVGLVENMPDGAAQRPGDVVKSADGQTIEVLNTDAEGRLVLADALWYVQKHYKPRLIVDLATLTGAIIVALGSSRAGLFSNNDELSAQLTAAGAAVGEELWRLPLGDVYDRQINSDIADMQNIGADREAGSITAAQFLKRFIKNETPWAHLDIAGTAWTKKDHDTCPKGATGFGVRLLDRFVEEHFEG